MMPSTPDLQSPAVTPSSSSHMNDQEKASVAPIELEQFNIDVQGLMRGLVHELRNPLSAILTAASLLGESATLKQSVLLDEESVMLLDVVNKEAKRMNSILSEFSYFVKPPVSNAEPFDVAQTLRNIVAQLCEEGTLVGVKIRDYLPESLTIFADENQIKVALTQVLQNSAEELNNNGELTFESDQNNHRTTICISDSGRGLSEEALEKAFQPFFSHKPASTGLGLSLARGAIRSSGGEITLKNRDGSKGARISIMLPSAASKN
jgi:signal transduction histidine kinase